MLDICPAQPPYRYGVRTLSSKDIVVPATPTVPVEVIIPEVPEPVPEEITVPEVPEEVAPVVDVVPEEPQEIAPVQDDLSLFSKKSAQALEVNGILSVAQLQAYLDSGKKLEELPKIGPKLEQIILEELKNFPK